MLSLTKKTEYGEVIIEPKNDGFKIIIDEIELKHVIEFSVTEWQLMKSVIDATINNVYKENALF